MKRIMVDLETLDTKPTAVILSIGAVQFDEYDIGAGFHMTCQVDEQLISLGRTISGATIDWWMVQSVEARMRLFDVNAINARAPFVSVLCEFRRFMQDADELWGNGAAFDNVILEDAFRRTLGVNPIKHTINRCFRTVKAYNPGLEPVFEGVKHDALADARHQARWLQNIWREERVVYERASKPAVVLVGGTQVSAGAPDSHPANNPGSTDG